VYIIVVSLTLTVIPGKNGHPSKDKTSWRRCHPLCQRHVDKFSTHCEQFRYYTCYQRRLSCVGRWWLDRASICRIRDNVWTASPVTAVRAVLAKQADHFWVQGNFKQVSLLKRSKVGRDAHEDCRSWKEALRSSKWAKERMQELKGSHNLRGHPNSQPSLDSYHNQAARYFGLTFFDHVAPMQCEGLMKILFPRVKRPGRGANYAFL